MINKSEEVLKTSKNKSIADIQFLADAIHLTCNFWDENFNIIDCNEKAVRQFNLSSKEEYINRFYQLAPTYQPDGSLSSEKTREMISKAFKDGKCEFEWMHQLLNGEPIPAKITLIRVQQQNSAMVVGYARDLREIIKEKKADERTRIMLDSVPLCCNFLDEHLNNIDCNQEAVKLFNLSSKQEYLDRFFDLSPKYQPDGRLSRKKAIEMVRKAFKDGKCVFEWMHQLFNGEPIPAEVTLIRVQQQNSVIVVGYTRDLRKIIKEKKTDERTRIMLDSVPLCCNFWDEHLNNIDCNQEAVKLFNLSSKQEYLDRFFDLSPKYQSDGRLSSEKAYEMIRKAFKEGKCVFEWAHQLFNGEPIPAEITLIRVQQENSVIVVGYTRDLREIIKAKQADARMRTMLDSVPLCCNFWDEDLKNIDCNQEAVKLFNLSSKQEYLDRFFDLSPEYQPDGRLSNEKAAEMLVKAFKDGKCVFEWMHRLLNGEPIPTEITLIRVVHNGRNIVLGYTQDLREIRKTIELLNNMEKLVNIDFLTGLYNHRYCMQALSELLQKKQGFSVCFIDIDNLKKVNDFYGHQNGDNYICFVAKELAKDLRKTDVLCRIGGDEFILIFINSDEQKSENKLKRINENILNADKEYPASISYGVVYNESDTATTIEDLLQQADKKMYLFKHKFKNILHAR